MQRSSCDLQAFPLLPWLLSSPNYVENKFIVRPRQSSHGYQLGREHWARRRHVLLGKPYSLLLPNYSHQCISNSRACKPGGDIKEWTLRSEAGRPPRPVWYTCGERQPPPSRPSTQAGKTPWLQGSKNKDTQLNLTAIQDAQSRTA